MKKIVLLLCSSIVFYTIHGQNKTKKNLGHRVPHKKTTPTPHKKRNSTDNKKAILAQLATQNQNESLALLKEALAQSQTLIQKVQSFNVSPDTPKITGKRRVQFNDTPQVHTFNQSDPISSTLPKTPSTRPTAQSTPTQSSQDQAAQEPAPHVPFYNPETFNTPKHKRFVKWQERYETASTSAPDIALPVSSGDVSPTEIQRSIDFIEQNHLRHVKYRNELYNKIALYIQKYFTYSKWNKTLKPRSTDPREISQRIYELTEMLSICSRYYPLDTYQFYSNGWLSDEPMTAKDVQQILHPEHQSIAANSVQTTRIPQDDAKTDILIALQNIQQNASLAQTPAEKNKLYEDIATFLEQHFEMDWYGYIVQKSYVPQFIVQQIQTIVRQCAKQWPTDEYPFFNIHPMLYSTRDTLSISYLSSIISYYDYQSPQDIINPVADPER
ncbi:hypothetical protein EBQ93_03275, partial [bacterium]|nr:hypothetical protein [bacterium]